MVEVEAKKVILKNLDGEYLVPITEPYIAGDGIKIEDNVISVNINKTGTTSVIVENYKSDASWYRVWSDGWIEQGGRTNAKTITFLKPFSDANDKGHFMSYKLEKPYTEAQRINFIVEYNHNKGLQIEETMEAMYALESNEIMQQNRPIINPNYETEQVQRSKRN